MDGLNTAMPFGVRKIDSFRTLTTESLSVLMPFRVQDVFHENGIYYGQNVISKNMIIADRRQLLNGNAFVLGVSGGGKSFFAKGDIVNIILATGADVIIVDPEREYGSLVNALGGEVINISATSKNHINAMDMSEEYGDGANPVILKSEFIMSLCEQFVPLGAKEKSIIDRCTANVYRGYQQRNYTGKVPTLKDFREELLRQEEPEAQSIALAIELFTDGSLNTFAKQTNVDTSRKTERRVRQHSSLLMKSTSCSSTSIPQTSSLLFGSVSVSTAHLRQVLHRTWTTCSRAIQPVQCSQTPNLSLCSIRLPPTERSLHVCLTFPIYSFRISRMLTQDTA